MSPEAIVAVVGGLCAVSGLTFFIGRKVPKRINKSRYVKKWRDIQILCSEKHNWPQAILLADQLLNDVLRRKIRDKKTMGERMVATQKQFTNNDAIWQAHKLANHIRQSPEIKLKEADVKEALVAFRQALRDLGAV